LTRFAADQLAGQLAREKIYKLVERTTDTAASWTDSIVQGTITNLSKDAVGQHTIEVECLFSDKRSNTTTGLIRHTKTGQPHDHQTEEAFLRQLVNELLNDIVFSIRLDSHAKEMGTDQ